MTVHVSPERLTELAKIEKFEGRREWNHIKDCTRCLTAFLQCLRELLKERGIDAPF